MSITKKQFVKFISDFDFENLFIHLGWDTLEKNISIDVSGQIYKLDGIAEMSGYLVMHCPAPKGIGFPDYNIRKQIENKFSKLYYEHLIIFTDGNNSRQVWQLSIKDGNKPKRTPEFAWNRNQDPESLYQRLRNVFFTIDEQDKITIIDVKKRISENFAKNAEKITKKFYSEFKKQHTAFLQFIKGIEDKIPDKENTNKQWYASLMLNRLMFCYFIQKKGFLDQDTDYLQNKLKECNQLSGKDKFFSFYRSFLLELFHEGLGKPEGKRKEKLPVELGKIPYLNGGLFDVHELESQFEKINITDEAFERIFRFFDEWNWHLDTRVEASGKDINPDVIGYIFEKYINDRAAMGAYYTKEDITDYITRNTIIPYLFDAVEKNYKKAFRPDAELWQFMKNSGNKYIYPAVKHGVPENGGLFDDLPEEIRQGFHPEMEQETVKESKRPHLWEIRKPWNTPAPETIANPTEIYREVIQRRKRYAEVKAKIENGEITSINDLITYNLDIKQFVQDYIESTADMEFIHHFYLELEEITVLDPTCGSGAFLFAALNVLEPLYDACIERMENAVKENAKVPKRFNEVLDALNSDKHPNREYFIYKTIILKNLYGVDLMNEAVEIAKLRLFLKLVGTVDMNPRLPNYGLEPLPDIDFNIRAGNTLVGYASEVELKETLEKQLFSHDNKNAEEILADFNEDFKLASKAYDHFKDEQTIDQGSDSFRNAKQELTRRLNELNEKLNGYLATNSGINPEKEPKKYKSWLKSHQPFHWFSEFYGILSEGGFDVIVGNPPYLSIKSVSYTLNNKNFNCSDLYGYVVNRCLKLLNENTRFGLIVMHNLAFSKYFKDLRNLLFSESTFQWFSFFARIPAGLFDGDVRVRNCIFLLKKANREVVSSYTTKIHRWFTESRKSLFEKTTYTQFDKLEIIPMFPSNELRTLYENKSLSPLINFTNKKSNQILYYKKSAYNWISVSLKQAPCFDINNKVIEQSEVGELRFTTELIKKLSLLLLNGKICYSHWLIYGDEFHVTYSDLTSVRVPFNKIDPSDIQKLLKLYDEIASSFENIIQYKTNAGKKVGTYNTSKLWPITNKSDLIFLKYISETPISTFEYIENHIQSTVISNYSKEDE